MKQITVLLKNEPGALSTVCDAVEKVGVNIISLFGGGLNEEGLVHLITEDEKTTQKVLKNAGYDPIVSEILVARVPDKPGELAKVIRKLAHAKINIETIMLLTRERGEAVVAIKVNNIEKAKGAIK
jgi:hypothetical protein